VTPSVSIIIASHRQNSIKKCLEGFVQDVLGNVKTEIIVVADYPVENLRKDYPEVLWIFLADKSISAKRNAGITHVRGILIGFIDDDCVPKAGWVIQAARYMEQNPLHAGVAGRTIVEKAHDVSYPLREFKRLENQGFRTNNIFYRKDILVKVGGFDPRFAFQREDVDLAFSILHLGLSIGYCPDIQVVHLHRSGENWDLVKNCYNRRFDPLLYKKHRLLYRKWIKTPFTPSIAVVMVLHGLFIAGACSSLSVGLIGACDLMYALALSVRRNWQSGFHGGQIARDWLSYCVSPFVLFGALVYGSVKFKNVLIF
jgi:Predicted glycosyltransferases